MLRLWHPTLVLVFLSCMCGVANLHPGQNTCPAAGASPPASRPSTTKERALGQAMFGQYLRSEVPWAGDRVNEYVNRLGQNLARASQSDNIFVFRVIYSPDLNAESFPGGFVVVHSGALSMAESESELAAVLAHEIAHVNARHWRRFKRRQSLYNLLALVSLFTGNVPLTLAVGFGGDAASPLTEAGFSRAFEREADRLAFVYLIRTGYDPQAMAALLARQCEVHTLRGARPLGLLSNHPSAAARLKTVQKMLARSPLSFPVLETTSEFESVRQEVRDYDAMHAKLASGHQSSGDVIPRKLQRRPSAPPGAP
jgi:predicted Zn-dependent protease